MTDTIAAPWAGDVRLLRERFRHMHGKLEMFFHLLEEEHFSAAKALVPFVKEAADGYSTRLDELVAAAAPAAQAAPTAAAESPAEAPPAPAPTPVAAAEKRKKGAE